jgi:hypothetical protein
MKMKTKRQSTTTETIGMDNIEPVSAEIKDGILQVDLVVGEGDEKIPIYIDLKKQLGSD